MQAFTIRTSRGSAASLRRIDYGESNQGGGFPSLERLLNNRASASAMRAGLTYTIRLLERVVRQGTKTDAMRAQRALEAWKSAFSFLDQLKSGDRPELS